MSTGFQHAYFLGEGTEGTFHTRAESCTLLLQAVSSKIPELESSLGYQEGAFQRKVIKISVYICVRHFRCGT